MNLGKAFGTIPSREKSFHGTVKPCVSTGMAALICKVSQLFKGMKNVGYIPLA
jgi:hypothetical protein